MGQCRQGVMVGPVPIGDQRRQRPGLNHRTESGARTVECGIAYRCQKVLRPRRLVELEVSAGGQEPTFGP
jgi:hypothetical protein